MSFYTFADTKSNRFFHRYVENGIRCQEVIEDFPLDLFTSSNSDRAISDQKTILGRPLQKQTFMNIESAREFVKNHGSIDGVEIHGQTNYANQFISKKYPDPIEFEITQILIGYIDIEVRVDGTGFPSPDKAAHEITAITLKISDGRCFTLGYGEYSGTETKYLKCKNERDLLKQFIEIWDDVKIDIISGWNIAGFDIPYIINRMKQVLNEKWVSRLSPFHESGVRNLVDEIDIQNNQKSYHIFGITIYDYIDLYKKFSVENLESYSLNFVSFHELGEKKIDYSDVGSIMNLMDSDHEKFIRYNIQDSNLVERLENKLKFINIAITTSFLSKARFGDVFSSLRLWDSLIYNQLIEKNIQIPPSKHHAETSIEGGYVKEPQIGLHSWVVTFDLASLYPSIIMGANLSPETLIRGATGNYVQQIIDDNFENFDNHGDECIIANGAKFTLDKHGMMPEITKRMFNLRKTHKKNMLQTRQKIEDLNLSELTPDNGIQEKLQDYTLDDLLKYIEEVAKP